jgi:hypothetical protein
MYMTTPNPVNLLIGCDFKTFTLSPACHAIALATDGVEFEGGLFHNHAATPFYEKVIADIADSDRNADLELQELACSLLCDSMNASKDNIGIAIMHRKPMEEAPVMEPTEEPAVEIVEEPVEEESEIEIVEEPITEEPEVEIVEEPVEEEIEVEIVEEPIAEEPEAEIVEEPIEKEIEVEIVEEPIEEEIEVEIVEEPVEEEIEVEIVEEPIAEEPEVEIVEEPVAEETEVEIVEEPIVEEPEEVLEEVEIEIIDDEEDEPVADTATQKSEASSEQPHEKKVSRTILKFFNVSIKKK